MASSELCGEQTIRFFDVITKAHADVALADVRKVRYGKSYALRGKHAGRWLTKFVAKTLYEDLRVRDYSADERA